MGQRLVVQIEENGNPLANAYYHWSGYTGSSIEMTTDVIDYLYNTTEGYNSAQRAVEALFRTGARFYPQELDAIKRENIDIAPYQFAFDEERVDRNNGLLSISEWGMSSSVDAEEAHVSIDIATGCISFDVYYGESVENYINEFGDEDLDVNSLPVLDLNYNLNLGTWNKFSSDIMRILDDCTYCATNPDHTIVYQFIA